MYKKLFWGGIILLFIGGCKPGWITKVPQPDKKYFYFTGISSGYSSREKGEQAAIDNAVGKIITYFGVEGETRYQEKRTQITTTIKAESGYRGEATVRRSFLKEIYVEKEKDATGQDVYSIYVLIQYPREEIEREIARQKRKLRDSINLAERNLAAARRSIDRGEFAPAFEAFLQGLSILKSTSTILADDPTIESKRTKFEQQLKSGLLNLLDELKFSTLGDNQQGSLGGGLAQPLEIRVVLDTRNIPVSKLPLAAKFLKGLGELSPQITQTDRNGTARIRVSSIKTVYPQNRIRIYLDENYFSHLLDEIPDEKAFIQTVKERLRSKYVDFAFSLPSGETIKVYVDISEMISSQSMLTTRIMDLLSARGFTLVYNESMADYKIVGEIKSRMGTTQPNIIYSCYVSIVLQAVNMATGEVITAVRTKEVREFGRNEDEAFTKALNQLNKDAIPPFIDKFISDIASRSLSDELKFE